MVRKMKAAKAAGYSITLVYVMVSMATSLTRNAARTRVVPEHVIRSKALDVATSFEICSQYADTINTVNND